MTPPIRMVSVPVDELRRIAEAIDAEAETNGALTRVVTDLDALLTAAPVREEGGAVAWLETNRDNGEQRATVRQPSDTPTMRKRWIYTPLYTHPAHDALRMAYKAGYQNGVLDSDGQARDASEEGWVQYSGKLQAEQRAK